MVPSMFQAVCKFSPKPGNHGAEIFHEPIYSGKTMRCFSDVWCLSTIFHPHLAIWSMFSTNLLILWIRSHCRCPKINFFLVTHHCVSSNPIFLSVKSRLFNSRTPPGRPRHQRLCQYEDQVWGRPNGDDLPGHVLMTHGLRIKHGWTIPDFNWRF